MTIYRRAEGRPQMPMNFKELLGLPPQDCLGECSRCGGSTFPLLQFRYIGHQGALCRTCLHQLCDLVDHGLPERRRVGRPRTVQPKARMPTVDEGMGVRPDCPECHTNTHVWRVVGGPDLWSCFREPPHQPPVVWVHEDQP